MARQNIKEFLQRLPELHKFLQANQMNCSPATWIRVHDLLLVLARQGRLPTDPSVFAPIIGPMVCNTPQQQEEFPILFEQWWTNKVAPATAELSGKNINAQQLQAKKTQAVDGTWGRLPFILSLLILLALMGGLGWQFSQETNNSRPPSIIKPPIVEPIKPIETENTPTIPIDDWLPPRRLGEWPLLPPSWTPLLQNLEHYLPWLPAIPILAWLLAYYRRRWVLSRAKSEGNELDTALGIQLPHPLFGSATAISQLRKLNTTQWQISRRLDVLSTVNATTKQAGMFSPQYLRRCTYPRYLVLVHSQHRSDQSAAMAEELVQRLREQNLAVESFRFHDDPNQLISSAHPEHETQSLNQLALKWQDARLIFISEGDILYHPLTGQTRPWLTELNAWDQPAWLHPSPMSETLSHYLWERDILPLPLATTNLESLVHWFTRPHARDNTSFSNQSTEPDLPRPLTLMPERWLEPLPPYKEDLDTLYSELQTYLEDDGWLLLQAIAVYPEPHWALTQALDFCLFQQHSPKQREQRFRLLARLPWIRLAYLPDYLREQLLNTLDNKQRKQLRDTYTRLLIPDQKNDGPSVIRLGMAVPSRRKLRQVLLDGLLMKHWTSGLNDPIFLNLVMGGKLSLLDFKIPRFLAGILPGARWRINPWPVLLLLPLMLGMAWGLDHLWQGWGESTMTQVRSEIQRWQNKGQTVNLSVNSETQQLGLSLQQLLTKAGYQVSVESENKKNITNSLQYPESATQAAKNIAAYFHYASYGATLDEQTVANSTQTSIDLHLNRSYQAGSQFQDRLLNTIEKRQPSPAETEKIELQQLSITVLANQQSLKPYTIFKDSLNNGKYAPEMIVIPAGSFLMGSPEDEVDRLSRESPQHKVTIERSFAIGRYEVTFADYQIYFDAIQADKTTTSDCKQQKLPADEGWGQNNRPVINVNFQQAQCYVNWISEQTGQTYRIPTEAEWEYVARAGSQQAYFWGKSDEDISKYSWLYKNTKKTQAVGKKRPNAFGLYDTSGNVWEWTQDCWHNNYKGAPIDGIAWLGANEGDCDRRVVRGGSWNSNSRYLRSAIRGRGTADGASGSLGFRVARAL